MLRLHSVIANQGRRQLFHISTRTSSACASCCSCSNTLYSSSEYSSYAFSGVSRQFSTEDAAIKNTDAFETRSEELSLSSPVFEQNKGNVSIDHIKERLRYSMLNDRFSSQKSSSRPRNSPRRLNERHGARRSNSNTELKKTSQVKPSEKNNRNIPRPDLGMERRVEKVQTQQKQKQQQKKQQQSVKETHVSSAKFNLPRKSSTSTDSKFANLNGVSALKVNTGDSESKPTNLRYNYVTTNSNSNSTNNTDVHSIEKDRFQNTNSSSFAQVGSNFSRTLESEFYTNKSSNGKIKDSFFTKNVQSESNSHSPFFDSASEKGLSRVQTQVVTSDKIHETLTNHANFKKTKDVNTASSNSHEFKGKPRMQVITKTNTFRVKTGPNISEMAKHPVHDNHSSSDKSVLMQPYQQQFKEMSEGTEKAVTNALTKVDRSKLTLRSPSNVSVLPPTPQQSSLELSKTSTVVRGPTNSNHAVISGRPGNDEFRKRDGQLKQSSVAPRKMSAPNTQSLQAPVAQVTTETFNHNMNATLNQTGSGRNSELWGFNEELVAQVKRKVLQEKSEQNKVVAQSSNLEITSQRLRDEHQQQIKNYSRFKHSNDQFSPPVSPARLSQLHNASNQGRSDIERNRIARILSPFSAVKKKDDNTSGETQFLRSGKELERFKLNSSQSTLTSGFKPKLATSNSEPSLVLPSSESRQPHLADFTDLSLHLERYIKKYKEQNNLDGDNNKKQATQKVSIQSDATFASFQLKDVMDKISDHLNDKKLRKSRTTVVSGSAKNQKQLLIPNYDISLAQAAVVFRENTMTIRRILEALGEIDQNDRTAAADIMINADALELVAMELGIAVDRNVTPVLLTDQERLLQRRSAAEEVQEQREIDFEAVSYDTFPPRPPVVCIMGHVDHGKTTLMDALRARAARYRKKGVEDSKIKQANGKSTSSMTANARAGVAGTEAGGITQVISAFEVPLQPHHDDREGIDDSSRIATVTFLDTPGHAAFRAMRQSGSDAADIIVLVVAADDGVSEQTIEILDFYKSILKGAGGAGISLVVAMNKIDKPGLDVEESRRRIEMQLLQQGILTEGMVGSGEFGLPVQLVPVSGLKGHGLEELIEALVLQAEVMNLRADHDASAEGVVLEAKVESGFGVVASCIVRWGSLSKGDIVVSGTSWGRVRFVKDINNNEIEKGLPSQPVRVSGFDTMPQAGEPLVCVESKKVAEQLVARRKVSKVEEDKEGFIPTKPELQSASSLHTLNPELWQRFEEEAGYIDEAEDAPIRIPIIVKADADGTQAVVRDELLAICEKSKHNVILDIVRIGLGPVLPADLTVAKESGALIVCFNVKNENYLVRVAKEDGISIASSDVIYTLLDEAKRCLSKYLPETPVEIVHGRARVKETFSIGGIADKVAGLVVNEGTLHKGKWKRKGESPLDYEYRVLRGKEVISTSGVLLATSMKHFKDNVDLVEKGKECGLSLAGHNDYEEGDIIECFSTVMKEQEI